MSEQTLRNARNETIAYIETKSDGEQVIRNARNETLGYFDPRSNTTRNARNETVGYGNLLTTLLVGV